MKKLIATLLFVFSLTLTKAQVHLIPDSVYFVMEADLGKIIKSIPLEEINKLEFFKNTLSQLNEATKDIKNISDLGIDFNSKLIAYTKEQKSHSNTSIIIPIEDKNSFIQLFDELDQIELKKNNIIFKEDIVISLNDNVCIISDIQWKGAYFSRKTRQLYDEKGWELPNNYYYMYEYDFFNYEETETTEEEYIEEYEDEEIFEEGENTYNEETGSDSDIVNDVEVTEEDRYEDYEESNQDALEKRVKEVMDSIKKSEKKQFIDQYSIFSKNPKKKLLSTDPIFKKVSSEVADAKIYYNPSMNSEVSKELVFLPFGKFMHKEFNEFRQFAYLNFTPEGIQVDWKLKSSENFGKVLNKAASGKFNKKLLDYIPSYAQGFGIYNINSFGAYQQLKETYLPLLDASEDGSELLASAIWSTIDEFINVDAIASVYTPQVVVSYGGLKEVELSKVTYDYDEETFQYTEVDTTYMESIPMITFALSNERAYLIEKYIKAIMKLEEDLIQKNGSYYTLKNDPAGLGFPYYIAIKEEIVLITNDENAVKNNLDGNDNKAFDRSIYKKAKNAKLVYAHLDFTQVTKDIASLGIFKDSEDFLNKFQDKTAKVDIEVASVDKSQINYSMKMVTNDKYKNGAYFLFDLINEIYLLNK